MVEKLILESARLREGLCMDSWSCLPGNGAAIGLGALGKTEPLRTNGPSRNPTQFYRTRG
jgi:hypothetical protein